MIARYFWFQRSFSRAVRVASPHPPNSSLMVKTRLFKFVSFANKITKPLFSFIKLLFYRTLNKLHLLNLTTPKLIEISVADKSFNALKVTINLSDVNLIGEFTAINTKMLELLPIKQQGFIE